MIIEISEKHGDIMLSLQDNINNAILDIDVGDWVKATDAARLLMDGFRMAGVECRVVGVYDEIK